MSRMNKAEENNNKWFAGEPFANGYKDAEFENIAKGFLCGNVLEHGSLSDKQRAIVILTTITASGMYETVENTLPPRCAQAFRQQRSEKR